MKTFSKKLLRTTWSATMVICLLQFNSYGQGCTENLIVNGSFENGNSGYYSDIIYDGSTLLAAEHYAINFNAHWAHPGLDNVYAQSGNNFMIVDGRTTNPTIVWQQTTPSCLVPGHQYTFSFYAVDVHTGYPPSECPMLTVDIANQSLINPVVTTGILLNTWIQYAYTFIATSTTATITINQANFTINGNDYGIDNIQLIGTYNLGVTVTSTACTGGCNGTATATATSNSCTGGNITYSWNTVPVSTTQTITGQCAGTYTVVVTDANGCTAAENVTIGPSCPSCPTVYNPDPIVSPVPDQSCWWSTGGNSGNSVNGNNNFIGTTNGNNTPLRLFTSGTERMRINENTALTSGFVGIHTTSPSEYLDVDGDGRFRTLPTLNDNTLTRIVAVDNNGKLWYRDASSFGGFANNCQNPLFVPKVLNNNGDMVCSQIYDLFPEIGIGTTNLLGIAQTGQLGLKCLGQSFFTNYDNATFRAYNPITNYSAIVNSESITDDFIPRGLMLNSPFPSHNATDLLCIYIDNKQTARFMTLGNLSVYRDRIYRQDLWGVDPARGVVMAPDFITQYQANGRRYDAKLFVESNSANDPACWYDNSGGNGFSAGVFANSQNNLWIAFNKTGVYGVSDGQAINYAYGPQNIAGNFIARYEHTNIAVIGRAMWQVPLPGIPRTGYNYGGYFVAGNANIVNYGVYATAPHGNCQNGSCFDAAGYFAGDVYTTSNQYYTSDLKLKNNIARIKNAGEILKKLKPYSYEFKTEKYTSMNLPQGIQYGFLAEDVESILPTLVKSFMQPDTRDSLGKITEKGIDFKALNYVGLIPFVVQGFQDQQKQIESQEAEIKNLKEDLQNLKDKLDAVETALSQCCTNFERQSSGEKNSDIPWLEQNIPNPFNQNTVIKYYVPQSSVSASINIYSLDGAKLHSFNISQKGAGQIEISGSTLAPGTYVYHLLVNGKQIDGKLMTLTK